MGGPNGTFEPQFGQADALGETGWSQSWQSISFLVRPMPQIVAAGRPVHKFGSYSQHTVLHDHSRAALIPAFPAFDWR